MESDVPQALLNGRRVAELGRQREAAPHFSFDRTLLDCVSANVANSESHRVMLEVTIRRHASELWTCSSSCTQHLLGGGCFGWRECIPKDRRDPL